MLPYLLDELDALHFLRIVRIQNLNLIFGVKEKVLNNLLGFVIFIENSEVDSLNLDIRIPNLLEAISVFVFFSLYLLAVNFDNNGPNHIDQNEIDSCRAVPWVIC